MSAYNRKIATLRCHHCGRTVMAHTARGGKDWIVSRLDAPPNGQRWPQSKPYICCGAGNVDPSALTRRESRRKKKEQS